MKDLNNCKDFICEIMRDAIEEKICTPQELISYIVQAIEEANDLNDTYHHSQLICDLEKLIDGGHVVFTEDQQ